MKDKAGVPISKKERNCPPCHVHWYPWLQFTDIDKYYILPTNRYSSVPCNYLEAYGWLWPRGPWILGTEGILMPQLLTLVASRFGRLILVGTLFNPVPRLVADEVLRLIFALGSWVPMDLGCDWPRKAASIWAILASVLFLSWAWPPMFGPLRSVVWTSYVEKMIEILHRENI